MKVIKKIKLGVLLLMTLGLSLTSNAQYLTEDFESSELPTGWTNVQVVGDLYWGTFSGGNTINDIQKPSASHGGTKNAYIAGNGSTWTQTKLVTPEIDLSSAINPKITFWHAQPSNFNNVQEKLRLYYKVSATSEWVLIQEWDTDIQNWQEENIQLPNPSSTYYIAFEAEVLYDYGITIDDVTITDNLSCIEPQNLSVTNIESTQAELSWTEMGTSSVWDIELIPAGTTPTGNPTYDNVGNPFIVTDLLPATDYEFYVRADCSSDNSNISSWVGPYTFSTSCSVIDAPYTQDFENSGEIPDCWIQGATNTDDANWLFTDPGSMNHVGYNGDFGGTTTESGGLFAWVDDSHLSFDNNVVMESPSINLSTISSPQLTFYMISNNEETDHEHESAGLKVYVWNGSDWNLEFTEENNTSGWVQKTVDLSSYSGIIKLKFEAYQVGPEVINYSYFDDLAIDDITIKSSNTTDINETSGNNIKIYPNPTNGNFNIKLDSNYDIVNLDIVNIQGQTVFSKHNIDRNSIHTINLLNVTDGMYFVKISSNNNATIVKKINVIK